MLFCYLVLFTNLYFFVFSLFILHIEKHQFFFSKEQMLNNISRPQRVYCFSYFLIQLLCRNGAVRVKEADNLIIQTFPLNKQEFLRLGIINTSGNHFYIQINKIKIKMLIRNIVKSSFSKVKPLKITGVTQGNGVHFKSQTGSPQIQIENPLECLIGSLAACQLATLRAISRGSTFKVHSVKYVKVESELDIEKFMKGGPQNKLGHIYIEAQVQSTGTQEDLDKWMPKAINSCPAYQMLKGAGVKIEQKWTNVKTLP